MANITRFDPFFDVDDLFRGLRLAPIRRGAEAAPEGLPAVPEQVLAPGPRTPGPVPQIVAHHLVRRVPPAAPGLISPEAPEMVPGGRSGQVGKTKVERRTQGPLARLHVEADGIPVVVVRAV